MKSKSIANSRVPCGMDEVESPRGVTYRVTCHEWLIQGVCASRTFPTICVQRCRVAAVSCHASRGSAGQVSPGNDLAPDASVLENERDLQIHTVVDDLSVLYLDLLLLNPGALHVLKGLIRALDPDTD